MSWRPSPQRRPPVTAALPRVQARTPEACRVVVEALVDSAELDPGTKHVAVIAPAWWAMGPWGRA